MKEDKDILEYVFRQPSPSYQNVGYTDWFLNFLERQKFEIEKAGIPSYYKGRYTNV
jgi:hypothetical protein